MHKQSNNQKVEQFKKDVLYTESLQKKGRVGDALRLGEDLLKVRPDYVPLLRILGYCCLTTDKASRALKYFNKALELDKHKIRALSSVADALCALGRKNVANKIYLKIIDETPISLKEAKQQIAIANTLENKSYVVKAYRKGIKLFNNEVFQSEDHYLYQWLMELSSIQVKHRECYESLDSLEQKIVSNPKNLANLLLYLLTLIAHGDHIEARKTLAYIKNSSLFHEEAYDKTIKMLIRNISICSEVYTKTFFRLLPNCSPLYIEFGQRLLKSEHRNKKAVFDPYTEQALDFLFAGVVLDKELVEERPSKRWRDFIWTLVTENQTTPRKTLNTEHLEGYFQFSSCEKDLTENGECYINNVSFRLLKQSFSFYPNEPEVIANLLAGALFLGRSTRAYEIYSYAKATFPEDNRFDELMGHAKEYISLVSNSD